jgi:hypothetical protein
MTLLQLAQKGRCTNVLENNFIQFFQHNNMIINKRVQKERNWLFKLIYDLQLHHACVSLETSQTHYSLPSTNGTHHSSTISPVTHISTHLTGMLTIMTTILPNMQLFVPYNNSFTLQVCCFYYREYINYMQLTNKISTHCFFNNNVKINSF